MKALAERIARVKILVSWVWSSSSAPIPYVSIIMTLIGSPSTVFPGIVLPQHHSPLVHGFTVGPTPNPLVLFKSIRLSKYDLPVLYMPATEITAIGPEILLMKFRPSSLRTYSMFNSKFTSRCIYLYESDRTLCFLVHIFESKRFIT